MENKEISREEFEVLVRQFYSDLIGNQNYNIDLKYNTLLPWARTMAERIILAGWEPVVSKKDPEIKK